MNVIDYGIIVILGFCVWQGWRKGFLRSLIGPVSMVVCFFYAYAYFKRTHQYWISLGIWVLGPMIVTILLNFFLWIFGQLKRKDGDAEGIPFQQIDRFLGGLFNGMWTAGILALLLILIALIPMQVSAVGKVRNTVLSSKSFAVLAAALGDRIAILKHPGIRENVDPDDPQIRALEKTEEYQALITDPRLQFLSTDADIRQKIDNKDFVALIQDERIQKIMQEPELVKKFLELNQRLIVTQKTLQ